MQDNKLLSISEFATAAGMSRQTIYNKLDKELSNFTVDVKGKKMLEIKALELFDVKDVSNEHSKSVNSVNGKFDRLDNLYSFDKDFTVASKKTIEYQKSEIDRLLKEIDKKDKKLERLETKLDEKDAEITKLNDALIDALDKAHKLTDQQQQIQAQLQTQLLQQPQEPIDAAEVAQDDSEQPIREQAETQPDKKSFWKRLFG